MLVVRVLLPISLSIGLFAACGSQGADESSSPIRGTSDEGESPSIDMSFGSSAPDAEGDPPDGSVRSPDMEPLDAKRADPTDTQVVEETCESYVGTHLYHQEAERFADYEMQEMCEYRGRVLLIANTAALCGLTPQYAGLQRLQERYGADGLTVLGFLSNDFGRQGGSNDQVEMCNSDYRISFEQFTPVGVLSSSAQGQHPIFEWLTTQSGLEGEVDWNFGKFLVSEDGRLLARWSSFVEPENTMITTAIEEALDNASIEE